MSRSENMSFGRCFGLMGYQNVSFYFIFVILLVERTMNFDQCIVFMTVRLKLSILPTKDFDAVMASKNAMCCFQLQYESH